MTGQRGGASPIYKHGPWRGLDDVEFATMTYVDWFNHRRVHSAITDDASYTTPAEHETNFYNQPQAPKQVAQATRTAVTKPGTIHIPD